MQKHTNKNSDIIMDKCQNNSRTGNIYKKPPATKYTLGVYNVKFTNISRLK